MQDSSNCQAMQEKDLLFDFDDLAIDESILPASTATATVTHSATSGKHVVDAVQDSPNESEEAKKESFVVSHGLYRDYLRSQINRV